MENIPVMKDVRLIIGIAGKKHSGKDTVASILYYHCIKNGNANYDNWYLGYSNTCGNEVLIHFADKLKDICAELFFIPRFAFDDSSYKDNRYFLYDKKCFVDKVSPDYKIFECDDKFSLADYIEAKDEKVAFTLRTIMQYVGTEIFRNKIAKNIWINYTLSRAVEIKNKYRICIIPDVRFEDEAKAIKGLGGKVIKVNRDIEFTDRHSSEQLNIDGKYIDYTIENNHSKFSLFYTVQGIYNELFNK